MDNPQSIWNSLVKTPLRNYQLRMCEQATTNGKTPNTIVVLPTGAGKTLIATALAAWHKVAAETTTQLTRNSGKTLFLVPTQMLVAQQGRAIEGNAQVRVALYHGELRWPSDPSKYDVLVSTPEAFRLQLVNGISFNDFSLVVFDEVHHVSKKHPYRKLATLLSKTHPQPTIVGLTATCTYAVGEKEIKSDIETLCAALGISLILSATQDELVRDGYHGSTPNIQKHTADSAAAVYDDDDEEGVVCDVFEAPAKADSKFMAHQNKEAFFYSIKSGEADPLVLRLMNLTREVEALVAKTVPTFASPIDASGKNGKVVAWSEYASKLKHPYANILLHLYEALRLLVVTWSAAIDLTVEYLLMTILNESSKLGSLATTLQAIVEDGNKPLYNRRLLRLQNTLLTQYQSHGGKFRGILFVQQKITTHILQNFIQRNPNLAMFKSACIYATAGEASPAFRVTPSQSKERVAQFASGHVNLLISTAVAEEGMDVPAANCIIRFDPIHTPVSLIQGRGRARQANSSFVVMEERKDRTVERLAQAEEQQMNLLQNQSKGIVSAAQSAEAAKKLQQSQQARERNAREYLQANASKPGVSPISVIKTFCAKSDREVVEACKKGKNDLWVFSASVLGLGGEVVKGEGAAASKSHAKDLAYQQIIAAYLSK